MQLGCDCMDRDSVLYQLMEVKMNVLQLPRETASLIDRYVNVQIEQGSRYGDPAYILGISDCY